MICPACGNQLFGDLKLCAHHDAIDLPESANNRLMCGLIHRGIVPARLAFADRETLSEGLD